MTSRQTKNVAASVHARLQNRSRETGEDFQFLLQRYAAERFLYRLGASVHRDTYVLKGAMLFALWGGSLYRATRDLDFTGYGSSETETVLSAIREICGVTVANDGLVFELSALAADPIRDDAEYDGLRIRFQAMLGAARIPMQIDVGFGDAIEPPASDQNYPTLLDGPVPNIRAYPREPAVAEKFHAMVVLGERNSRYKDFNDVYGLAMQFQFEGERLARAITATFARRRTLIGVPMPTVLVARYYADAARAEQWRAYLRRNSSPDAPADFTTVGELLQTFLAQPWSALAEGRGFSASWSPGGPWTTAGPK